MRTKDDTANARSVKRNFPATPLSWRVSKATATVAISQAANAYTPVSEAVRNAATQSNAARLPKASVRARPSVTAYQPRRKRAKRRTGNAGRKDGSQKMQINSNNRARFHAGCSG